MTHSSFSVMGTPTLIFSGTGRVKVQALSSGGYLGGDNTVSASDGLLMGSLAVQDFSFEVPSELWAVSSSTTGFRVLEWY